MQPHGIGTIACRSPCFRLPKQRVGGPRFPKFRIVFGTLPCEGPESGRRDRRPVTQAHDVSARVGEAIFAQALGGAVPHRRHLCPPGHETLGDRLRT